MLQKVKFAPGFNKQVTATGAEGQWTDGDFVRFRYGLPEKIGGWEQITSNTLVGAARDQLVWADLDGRRYSAIGTNKALIIYFEGAFYDITPLDSAITGATFTTVNTSPTVTVNKVAHTLSAGDLITFTSVTPPTGAGYVAADFTTNTFEVVTVPSQDTFTITMAANAGTSVGSSGAATINPYVKVGPLNQTSGFGYGTSGWGGSSGVISTLNGLLLDDTAGTGGSGTSITLSSVTGFPTTGTIKVGTEFISYTGISSNDLTGITRGVAGTRSAHSTGASVEVYLGWGSASLTGGVTLESASWSLDHFGQKLIATVKNGKTFEWDPISASTTALETRATVVSGAPTASVMSIVSERDRHLIVLGADPINDAGSARTGTVDPMLIAFSDQENNLDFEPTITNTAGSLRLSSGSSIIGAVKSRQEILVWTDTALYSMQFVGPPFTFSVNLINEGTGLIDRKSTRLNSSHGYISYDVFCLNKKITCRNNI